jgi:putative tryptophan/tyrosine transport system substrate-binding protein
MNRRGAVSALLALGTAAGPLGPRAQSTPPAGSRTLGILTRQSSDDVERLWLGALRAELKARGWIEGQNLVIEKAFAGDKAERVRALAEELVRKRVDVIWAFLPEAAVAAARATKTIPIVFVGVAWPVETGLVDSFARPGRNVTGVSAYTGIEVSTKRLEFLKEIAPTATRLSWILDSRMQEKMEGGDFDIRPLLDPAANGLGYEVRYHYVGKGEDFEPAFADILKGRAQSLAVAGSAVTVAARARIAAFALHNRLPSACASPVHVDAGCLLSYSSYGEISELIARGVGYVDRILRGARPAELPVYRPDRYELLINLRTAKALGLQIPQSVLLRAHRVIE